MVKASLKRRARDLALAVKDTAWPLTCWRKDREIHLRTYYPGCTVKISTPDGRWNVEASNRDPNKIPTERITSYFHSALTQGLGEHATIHRGRDYDFRIESVSLENWRDFFDGRIDDLINDTETEFETPRIGAFGYLKGETKPARLSFVKAAERHPERFEYIATEKYTTDYAKKALTLLEYKRRFKYVIDLPGHTYSTKTYWMLFLKRPLFFVEPNLKFHWERRLKPWVHYIPVRRNLSDLSKRYAWAEDNPDKVAQISDALYRFGLTQLPPQKVVANFVDTVAECLQPRR